MEKYYTPLLSNIITLIPSLHLSIFPSLSLSLYVNLPLSMHVHLQCLEIPQLTKANTQRSLTIREYKKRQKKERKNEKRREENRREEERNAVLLLLCEKRLVPSFSPALRFKAEVTVCGLVKGIWLTLWIQSVLQNPNLKNESSTPGRDGERRTERDRRRDRWRDRRTDRWPRPKRGLVFKLTLEMKTELQCGEMRSEESWLISVAHPHHH